MKDILIRATAADGAISLVAVLITEAINDARKRHSLSYLTSALLGRAMSTSILLASSMKLIQGRVTIKVQSDGPLNGLYVDAGRDGTIRGFVGNPNLELDLIQDKNTKPYFNFKSAVGKGYLHVTKDTGSGEPFTSTVELVQGGIGEDIASYLLHSEQIQSAVFVGEKIRNNKLVCSGALIAQILPNDSENEIVVNQLDHLCKNIQDFGDKLYYYRDNFQLIFPHLFPSLNPKIISSNDSCQEIRFKCRCSRSRSIKALRLLGRNELINILEEEKQSEVVCKFCNSTYIINEIELKGLINDI